MSCHAFAADALPALVGVLRDDDGTCVELDRGEPLVANFQEATQVIKKWQDLHRPARTLILLDQPTIVTNAEGQRHVEKIVSSPVGRRRGGAQPANTGRATMFGESAPAWAFLRAFGGAADPDKDLSIAQPANAQGATLVIETYPALALIAQKCLLTDVGPSGRLPKYNPRRKFCADDWKFVCRHAADAMRRHNLRGVAQWLESRMMQPKKPSKEQQDGVDASICLLVALRIAAREACLIVGDRKTGYMVVPHSTDLEAELRNRCEATGLDHAVWPRVIFADAAA